MPRFVAATRYNHTPPQPLSPRLPRSEFRVIALQTTPREVLRPAPETPCLNTVAMLLSVIAFGLGFASMPRAKPEGKCACGTYPLYLTEAEAGNSMCRRLLK